jgi:replicative DNA helicase
MAADNEHRLVSKVIRDRDILPVLQKGVTPDWFLDEDNARVWKFVIKHYGEYSEVPTAVTVKDHYPTYKVLDVQDSLDFLVDQAVAFRRKLLIRQGLEDSVQKLTSNDHEGALVAMEAAITRVNTSGVQGTNELELTQDATNRFAEYQALASHTMIGIPTGFDKIDEATAGLQGGQLITVIAPPKTGKSQIALAVAIHVHKQGKVPMFQSFEMTNREIQQRHDSIRAQISHGRLRRGKLFQDEEARYMDMLKDMETMTNREYLVDAVNGLTVASLSATISKLKPDVVFVDGVYLMMDEQTGEMNTPQSITNVTRSLKRLAQRHDIPVIITTQTLLWKMRGGKVSADSIGYSSSFFQDSDVILGLEPVPDYDDLRNFKIVASRNCGPSETTLTWNWETGCFHEETKMATCAICKRGLFS